MQDMVMMIESTIPLSSKLCRRRRFPRLIEVVPFTATLVVAACYCCCCCWFVATPRVDAWCIAPAIQPIRQRYNSYLPQFPLPNTRGRHTQYCHKTSQVRSLTHTDHSSEQTSDSSTRTDLLSTLLLWFQGDFDNYRQVVVDRTAGLLPREYGGHEHIHCTFVPVTDTTRLAAFYFDGIPNAIFRFRFYQLQSTNTNDNSTTVDTILYTLSKELEGKLRACSDPMQWSGIFVHHVQDQCNDCINEKSNDHDVEHDIVDWAIKSSCVTLLPRCDVRWSWERDQIQHSYVSGFFHTHNDNSTSSSLLLDNGIHAIMVHGEALVNSQMTPGQQILIKDQLSIWHDQLWIHDRGYDPVTGAYIYGNQNGIPYRMERVTDIVYNDKNDVIDNNINSKTTTVAFVEAQQRWRQPPQRMISDSELAWTLGSDYRTQSDYDTNMQRIGGSSRKQ